MKRLTGLLGLTLALSLLSACGHAASAAPSPASSSSPALDCVIVDGAEDGSLLLAETDGSAGAVFRVGAGVETVSVTVDGNAASWQDLRDGMRIRVTFDGSIMETYPAQPSGVTAIAGETASIDDRCGLYLQVLEDLWTADPGLNDGITELGVDLSGLTDLSGAEKSAVAWRFGELHGIVPLEASYDELVEEGYIDGKELYWEDGCLFTLSGSAEAGFDAQKWRSGLGAYFFTGCTARRSGNGSWTYRIGAEAIS